MFWLCFFKKTENWEIFKSGELGSSLIVTGRWKSELSQVKNVWEVYPAESDLTPKVKISTPGEKTGERERRHLIIMGPELNSEMMKTKEKDSDSLPSQGRHWISHLRPFPPIWISAVLVSQTLMSFSPAAPSLTFLPLLDLRPAPASRVFCFPLLFPPALSSCPPLAPADAHLQGALPSPLTLSLLLPCGHTPK